MKIGDKVNKFTCVNQNDQKINSEDFKGKNIVLYFYPKDNTPGCTMEAKDFRNNIDKFKALNTVVLGVSRDSVSKHSSFCGKYDLNFDLLADTDGKLCEQFGVWVEKSMFGKKYMGIERSTFIINTEGEVAAVWSKVKVRKHVDDVLKVLAELS